MNEAPNRIHIGEPDAQHHPTFGLRKQRPEGAFNSESQRPEAAFFGIRPIGPQVSPRGPGMAMPSACEEEFGS